MVRLLILLLLGFSFSGCAQNKSQPVKQSSTSNKKEINVGGPCEGCEAIYLSKTPFEDLNEVDTLPDFTEAGPKLVISGTVYKADGRTPAPNVVLYVYHTDQNGRYTNRYNEEGWAGRHGYIKGWMKTNAQGQYKFYTLRPASYTHNGPPAHIHPVIKEPGLHDYYIDEYLFDDEPFLTEAEKKKQEGRGGSGILTLTKRDGILYGVRDIYLGRNVPDYPAE